MEEEKKINRINKMRAIGNAERPFFEIYYFCLSFFLTLLYKFPLIAKPSTVFYGSPYDSLGTIWAFWWLKFSYLHKLPLIAHTYLAYPFGQDFSYNPFPYLLKFSGFIFTFVTNEIIAFNLIKLISLPLLALAAYCLLYYLTQDRLVSAIIGLAYSFAPFHVVHDIAHFANDYWMPLAFLFLLKLLDFRKWRYSILFGVFWGFALIDNMYYGYFIGLFSPVVIIAFLIYNKKWGDGAGFSYIKFFLISFFVFFLLSLPMLYPVLKGMFFVQNGQQLVYGLKRTFSDLFIFSAKPLDYLLPSKYNPFLGRLIPDLGFGTFKGHRYTEHTLYLGYALMFLGGYALYCAVRKIGMLGKDAKKRHIVYLFFAVAVIAAILSAPPFIPLGNYQVNFETREVIAQHKLYLPQYFLFKLFPMFRVYAKMAAMVLLAVSILAAFGLKEILNRINTRRGRILFSSFFLLIIFIEYAEFPPFRFTEVKEPAVYKWLVSQAGEFPIVEYPMGPGNDPYTTYEYSFYQRLHAKPLVNGAIKDTPADYFRKEIVDISKKDTVDKLQKIGVRYILIHRYKYIKGNEYVPLDWVTTPPREKIFPPEYNDGKVPDLSQVGNRLRMVKDFKDTVVYEIVQDF